MNLQILGGKVKVHFFIFDTLGSYSLICYQKIHFSMHFTKKTATHLMLKFNILLYTHVWMRYQEKVMKFFLNKSKNSYFHRRAYLK